MVTRLNTCAKEMPSVILADYVLPVWRAWPGSSAPNIYIEVPSTAGTPVKIRGSGWLSRISFVPLISVLTEVRELIVQVRR